MKARFKATGEIVEVQRLCMSSEGDIWQSETGQEYLAWMLDFDFKEEPTPKYIPDYWTRLEHTYAGMAMQGLVTRGEVLGATKQEIAIEIADISDIIAHALVEKMKEERK